MKNCVGAPAENLALGYLEGTLPEFEMERFEEHYFSCPVCLAHLQALEAVGQELSRQPPVDLKALARKRPFELPGVFWPKMPWPNLVWAVGAAAVVVVGVLGFRVFSGHAPQSSEARNAPQITPQSTPANPPGHTVNAHPQGESPLVSAAQLADLAMPVFAVPNLRGESEDAHYLAGMKAYSGGDYSTAVAALAQVPATADEARSARFFSGACQMRLGNLAGAARDLRTVADAGDSPEQEAALYYLAQTALLGGDLDTAHRNLLHAITLQGDLERRARQQDSKVLKLIEERRKAADASSRSGTQESKP